MNYIIEIKLKVILYESDIKILWLLTKTLTRFYVEGPCCHPAFYWWLIRGVPSGNSVKSYFASKRTKILFLKKWKNEQKHNWILFDQKIVAIFSVTIGNIQLVFEEWSNRFGEKCVLLWFEYKNKGDTVCIQYTFLGTAICGESLKQRAKRKNGWRLESATLGR